MVADFSEIAKQFKQKQAVSKKPQESGRIGSSIQKYSQDKISSEFKLVEIAAITPDPTQPRRIKDTKSRSFACIQS